MVRFSVQQHLLPNNMTFLSGSSLEEGGSQRVNEYR
jgi:hypothetical protein